MRHPHQQGALVVSVVLALGTSACAGGSGMLLGPDGPVRRQANAVVQLNPQPEPPSLKLGFALSPDGGDWYGTVYVGGQACGSIQLLATTPRQTGVASHVGYTLTIAGDNPDFQLAANLAGVVTHAHVVLNGVVSSGFYAGQTIHPRGVISTSNGGPVDELTTLTGTVQLNPQPEPPSAPYPPSPCTG